MVDVVESSPHFAKRYAKVDRERTRGLADVFRGMVGIDLEPSTTNETISAIVATCTLTARFWLSEMRLSFNDIDPATVIDHYLAIIAHALWNPATPAARQQLQPFLEGIISTEQRAG